jgi:ubiquinone/menaquinone biosynthesis C-methylase UbiE
MDVLQQQIAYYRARAGEYHEWFYRIGRYDRGTELNKLWFDEVAVLIQEVQALGHIEHTLELACGTGIWTRELAKISKFVTALDASTEVMEINRSKINSEHIEYREADLFNWQPDTQYDLVFMAFWMSHVPPEKLDGFLDAVRRATREGGRVFMIDSMPDQTSTASNHAAYQPDHVYHTRILNDGREFKIVKVFYEADTLERKLAEHGFQANVSTTGRYFWWSNGQG